MPLGVDSNPTVVPTAVTLTINWVAPTQPNGELTEYRVTVGAQQTTVPPDQTSLVVSGLNPNQEYEVTITACNVEGCTTGDPVTATTLKQGTDLS